jgi:hypothetical protein
MAGCEPPVEYTDLAIGPHTFAVRATDVDGNVGPEVVHAWTVEEPAPPPVECTTVTTTFDAAADAWIDQGSPSANNGTDSNLKVMSKLGANLRALVRFNLPASLPAGCVVQSATLRLYAGSSASGRTLQALQVNGSWTEGGVTWGNQPATTGPAATTTSGTGYRQWDVTTQVQAQFDAGVNHGLLIRDAAEGQDAEQQFHSREKAPDNPPQLVISFAAPPPPDTTAPETSLSGQPSDPTTATSASFVLGGTDDGGGYLTYLCQLDGTGFAPCTSPATYNGLAVGTHTFEVAAVDGAGNVDASPASHVWTITAPPVDCGATQTITANADSWIDESSPSTNKGTDSSLKVRSKNGASDSRTLVGFALPATPQGCVLQSATLRVNAGSAVNGRTLQALRVTSPWSEGTVTWSNQPSTTGAAATTSSGQGWRQWTVTSQVETMYSSGTNHGFLIRDANENSSNGPEQSFFSRESGTNRPQLVLSFVPIG